MKTATREPLTDVWELESTPQQDASDDLAYLAASACEGNRSLQSYLRKLWDGESWQSIKAKLETEGSAWYVWWMDGANQHLYNLEHQS